MYSSTRVKFRPCRYFYVSCVVLLSALFYISVLSLLSFPFMQSIHLINKLINQYNFFRFLLSLANRPIPIIGKTADNRLMRCNRLIGTSLVTGIFDQMILTRHFVRRTRSSEPWFDSECRDAKRLTMQATQTCPDGHRALAALFSVQPPQSKVTISWYNHQRKPPSFYSSYGNLDLIFCYNFLILSFIIYPSV